MHSWKILSNAGAGAIVGTFRTESFDELILFWLEIPYYQIERDAPGPARFRSLQMNHW